MQRHTMTEIVNHSRSAGLERSVKCKIIPPPLGVGEGGVGGLSGEVKSILRGNNPRPLFCRGIFEPQTRYSNQPWLVVLCKRQWTFQAYFFLLKGAVSIRPVLGLKPIFLLIILNLSLCIGFMYANYLVEWSNRLEDIYIYIKKKKKKKKNGQCKMSNR